jgi:hypothetical protein
MVFYRAHGLSGLWKRFGLWMPAGDGGSSGEGEGTRASDVEVQADLFGGAD